MPTFQGRWSPARLKSCRQTKERSSGTRNSRFRSRSEGAFLRLQKLKPRRSQKVMEDAGMSYLAPEELVERFKNKITLKRRANWRARGDGPKFTRAGGRILYPLKQVMS